MGDLISRQAAIDRINKQREHLRPDIYEQDYIGDAAYKICAEFIRRLPSAQQWIPCSERLPDITDHHTSEPCIVYCDKGAYGFAELEENIFGQVGWNCERDDEYHEAIGTVVAWMPLPDPWKGDNE